MYSKAFKLASSFDSVPARPRCAAKRLETKPSELHQRTFLSSHGDAAMRSASFREKPRSTSPFKRTSHFCSKKQHSNLISFQDHWDHLHCISFFAQYVEPRCTTLWRWSTGLPWHSVSFGLPHHDSMVMGVKSLKSFMQQASWIYNRISRNKSLEKHIHRWDLSNFAEDSDKWHSGLSCGGVPQPGLTCLPLASSCRDRNNLPVYPLLSSQQGIVDTLDGGLPGKKRSQKLQTPYRPPFTQAGSGCGCCHYNANDCEYWPNTINLTCTSCILTIAVESMHLQKTVCKKSRSLQLG